MAVTVVADLLFVSAMVAVLVGCWPALHVCWRALRAMVSVSLAAPPTSRWPLSTEQADDDIDEIAARRSNFAG